MIAENEKALENFEGFTDDLCHRLVSSLESEKKSDMAQSLQGVFEDLQERIQEKPLQAIGAAVAMGFVVGKILRSNSAAKMLGQGVGSLLASKFLAGKNVYH